LKTPLFLALWPLCDAHFFVPPLLLCGKHRNTINLFALLFDLLRTSADPANKMKSILAIAAVAALCTVTEAGTVLKKPVPTKYVEEAREIVAEIEKNATLALGGTTCGGNCPSADCPSCPCGTSTSYQDAVGWCAKYSGWNQAQCQCIMRHESSANANAANYNTNGSFDIGLWQINSVSAPLVSTVTRLQTTMTPPSSLLSSSSSFSFLFPSSDQLV
jgi:C-type lysozyme/alpha-lactalbumin family